MSWLRSTLSCPGAYTGSDGGGLSFAAGGGWCTVLAVGGGWTLAAFSFSEDPGCAVSLCGACDATPRGEPAAGHFIFVERGTRINAGAG